MTNPLSSRLFYHIYPLGMCGCPLTNDFSSPAGTGLDTLRLQIPHLKAMNVTAVYIGPLFESGNHGYDTLDYFHVDRRLGNNESLTRLIQAYHENGIAVVLDAVFNHVGKHFHAFKDLAEKKAESSYKDWFVNVDFSRKSPCGTDFSFEGWSGHYDLAKLNTENPVVRDYLISAALFWIDEFDIDGLRLDAADVLAPSFMDALSASLREKKRDFYLLGEVVHGDYRNWAREGRLHSVTNYELFKGLWSSFNDSNFYELSWTLNRQFGTNGLYTHLSLYNFVDNHDVNRLCSTLNKREHAFPVYGLLMTLPGTPSVYYGSEWGFTGRRTETSDRALRPFLEPHADSYPDDLFKAIQQFSRIRREIPALTEGNWRELYLSHEQYAFERTSGGGSCQGQRVIVAVNSSQKEARLELPAAFGYWQDALDGEAGFSATDGKLTLSVPPSWLRILVNR